jgi:hypothetical protein
MKLYASKELAAANEGIIHGIDDSTYASLDEAQAEFADSDNVFAWTDDNGNIRVGWTASQYDEEATQC